MPNARCSLSITAGKDYFDPNKHGTKSSPFSTRAGAPASPFLASSVELSIKLAYSIRVKEAASWGHRLLLFSFQKQNKKPLLHQATVLLFIPQAVLPPNCS